MNGAVAKSYFMKGFLIYEEIYDFATAQRRIPYTLGNFIFSFYSV